MTIDRIPPRDTDPDPDICPDCHYWLDECICEPDDFTPAEFRQRITDQIFKALIT